MNNTQIVTKYIITALALGTSDYAILKQLAQMVQTAQSTGVDITYQQLQGIEQLDDQLLNQFKQDIQSQGGNV